MMQHADIAEATDVVEVVVGRDARHAAAPPEAPPPRDIFKIRGDRIEYSSMPFQGQWMTAFFQAVACSLAWAIDALASASACLARA